jgi:hypothetical protein
MTAPKEFEREWQITVDGDQHAWQDFCESFMSDDIRLSVNDDGIVVCHIRINPWKPIDSTGSMPSFISQARNHHAYIFTNITAVHL